MTIEEVISKFNTTPFLFIGSGMTRRYLNLPDWRGLLEHFAKTIKNDDFAYSAYENRANGIECKVGVMPKIAELIQRDYDDKWFKDMSIRMIEDEVVLKMIRDNGLSPFKAEVAEYIKSSTIVNSFYEQEIRKLAEISDKSISGIITTNYDSFLEDTFKGFKKYVGQTQLIFSAIQGIAEIYKIHGSIENPSSIVINEQDYLQFDKNSAYLAAKLMTIFMEYPIIFMGYSLNDSNVINIIKSIVNCLDEKQIAILQERFVFVEWKKDFVGVEVTPHTIMVDDKPLMMRRVELDDFKLLYSAMENKKAKLPVKILRRFKQELYDYTITNVATSNLRVAALDDKRVPDDELVLAIGKFSDIGLRGLSGIDSNEWYRNIIIENLDFSADELLEYAFPKILKQNSGRLPVNKYLSESHKDFPECRELAEKQTFDYIISKTIKKNRRCLGEYKSVMQIWNQEKSSLQKATNLISHLNENQINLVELERILKKLFEDDINLLQKVESATRTNIRRLIMIYDYLKWGK